MLLKYSKSIAPDLSAIGQLAEDLSDTLARAGLNETLIHQINLCLDEVLSNIIRHGSPGAGALDIRVSLCCDHEELRILVSDNGIPFDSSQPPSIPAQHDDLMERPLGGLGIHIVHSLMDQILYQREQGRNHLKLRKKLV
jgi:anti-sigma regulatory factor (Ser/Thr protein kinase)